MEAPAEPAARRAQIVTLTMNPALDITTSVDTVRPTENCAARQRVTTRRRHQRRSDRARTRWVGVSRVFPSAGRPAILLCRFSTMRECDFDKLRSRRRRLSSSRR
jgi:6-phosphofructokinase 2